MPYREKILSGTTAVLLAEEMRVEVDTALAAHGSWTKVTSANASNGSYTQDVWQNNGTADGYGWFLNVAKSKSVAHVALGAGLEYDVPTTTFKKALRGYNAVGFVDATGYPLVSAGGAEVTFPLSTFAQTTTGTVGALSGLQSAPVAAVATNWFRTLVTARSVWIGWGSSTVLSYSGGVSTYQNLHSTTEDLKPLSTVAVNHANAAGPTTVWQHPSASDGTLSRAVTFQTSAPGWEPCAASVLSGTVGGVADLVNGAPVGARMGAFRNVVATTRYTVTAATAGGILGLFPSDFLVFGRVTGSGTIGDTVTVGGKTYISVETPNNNAGLFVCTQPST